MKFKSFLNSVITITLFVTLFVTLFILPTSQARESLPPLDALEIAPLQEDRAAVEWIKKGSFETLRQALDNGLNPNLVDTFYGMSLLQWAAAYGKAQIIELLLDRGADLNHRTAQGLTAAGYAKYDNDIPTNDPNQFHADRHEALLTLLIEPGFDFKYEIDFAIQYDRHDYAHELRVVRRTLLQAEER